MRLVDYLVDSLVDSLWVLTLKGGVLQEPKSCSKLRSGSLFAVLWNHGSKLENLWVLLWVILWNLLRWHDDRILGWHDDSILRWHDDRS